MERLIYHIDVNNAFLSWEALQRLQDDPTSIDIRTIPSAICGDPQKRHGIILAKSPLAKQYHISTAETIQSALKKCPQLQLFPSRYHVYQQYSNNFHKLLTQYTDCIEPFSIDEAFLDMTSSYHLFGDKISTAQLIQTTIYNTFGFTVNIGISTNKVLAKMASDFEKPFKIHTLFPDEIEEKLWPLPIERLLFAGKSTCQKLKLLGIHTIGDLANTEPSYLIPHLGKHGMQLYQYANGIDNTPVCPERPDAKGYSNSITIDHDVTEQAEAKQILLSLCETIGFRLRKDEKSATCLSVQIKDCFFKTKSKQCTLPEATNHSQKLYELACSLFDTLWDHHTPIRLLSVHATKLSDTFYEQLSLFDTAHAHNNSNLDHALDEIRNKFGSDSIMRASFLNTNYDPIVKRHANKDKKK